MVTRIAWIVKYQNQSLIPGKLTSTLLTMDQFIKLTVMCIFMFAASLSISYLPHLCAMRPSFIKALNAYGAGLLIGVAFLVIIPEGVALVYESLSEHVHDATEVSTN